MSSYETDKSWNPIDRQSEAITKIPNRAIIKRTSEPFELLLDVHPALRYLESIEPDQHSDYGFRTVYVFGLRSLTLPLYIQSGPNSGSSPVVNNFFIIQNACSPWSPDILGTRITSVQTRAGKWKNNFYSRFQRGRRRFPLLPQICPVIRPFTILSIFKPSVGSIASLFKMWSSRWEAASRHWTDLSTRCGRTGRCDRQDGIDKTQSIRRNRQDGVDKTESTRGNRQDGIDKTQSIRRNRQDGIGKTESARRNRQDGIDKTESTRRNRQDGIDKTESTRRNR
jgi:hypothetical protein